MITSTPSPFPPLNTDRQLYEGIAQRAPAASFTIRAQFLEIYNEEVNGSSG